jgi:hypothetical protein
MPAGGRLCVDAEVLDARWSRLDIEVNPHAVDLDAATGITGHRPSPAGCDGSNPAAPGRQRDFAVPEERPDDIEADGADEPEVIRCPPAGLLNVVDGHVLKKASDRIETDAAMSVHVGETDAAARRVRAPSLGNRNGGVEHEEPVCSSRCPVANSADTRSHRLRREGSLNEHAKPVNVPARRYKSALRATVAASAAPYGYTLTIWTSGAVLSHARGIPTSADALLFLVGAVAAYALVGGVAFGGFSEQLAPEPARSVMWGGLHLFSVGLAIGAATLVAHIVQGTAAWPLGAFLVTALYLLASASQLAVAHVSRRSGKT